MNITVIGAGYVGLVTAVCLAEIGHDILCIDNNIKKVQELKAGKSPIFEEGLENLLNKHLNTKLNISSNISDINNSDIILIAVGTPVLENKVNLDYVWNVVKDIVKLYNNSNLSLIIKSTVPAGTALEIAKYIKDNSKINCSIISNPEFLREGLAVQDFFNPDRIVVGTNDASSIPLMQDFYEHFIKNNVPIVFTDNNTAELIKYASNAFLAAKIAFINEMADFCEKLHGNINDLSYAVGLDHRIGNNYLKAGPGFGGSCFPKDLVGLLAIADENNIPAKLLHSIGESNEVRKEKILDLVVNACPKNSKIAILGVTFKSGTDDIRDSPAVSLIESLLERGYKVNCSDPKGIENMKKEFPASELLSYFDDPYDTLQGTDIAVIMTEWPEFAKLDSHKIVTSMNKPILLDMRNIMDGKSFKKAGVNYYSVGNA